VVISNRDWWWSGDPPKFWLVESLRPGQISYNSFGESVAEIINTEIFSLGGPNKQAYIDLKLKVTYDKKRQIYLYNFQPIQIGKPIDITFGSNNVFGLVVALDSEPEQRLQKKILIKMGFLEGWLANSYKVGSTMVDSRDNALATIDKVDVRETKIEKVRFLNGTGYFDKNDYFDVYMEVTISAIKDQAGDFYFVDGASIKKGEEIWFHFPDVVAKSTIVDVLE
jgi:hypothetical protein